MYKQSVEGARAIYEGLKEAKMDIVMTLPCGWLTKTIDLVSNDTEWIHLRIHREEEGVGVATGAYLGGKRAAMIIQNHGLGNSINALASLCMVYKIPLLLMMSDRGYSAGEIRGHFLPLGQATRSILKSIGIPWFLLEDKDEAKRIIVQAQALAENANIPVTLFISRRLVLEEV